MMTTGRNQNFDITKGLAMSCVLLGHVIQCCNGKLYMAEAFWDNTFYKFIYSFHLPLFAIISGYLVYYSLNRHTHIENIVRKCKQLLLPIVSLAIVFCIVSIIIGRECRLFNSVLNAVESLWFLWAVFIAFVIVLVINSWCNTLITDIVALILVVIGIFWVDFRFFLNPHKYIICFYIIGYLLNKYKCRYASMEYRIRKVLFLICMGGVIVYLASDLKLYIYTSYSLCEDISKFMKGFPPRIILCSMSTYAVFHLVIYIRNKVNIMPIMNLFSIFSKYSIGLYFFQDVIFYIFLNYYFVDFDSFSGYRTTLIFILLIIVCFGCSSLCNRVKFARIVVLGLK